MKKRWLYLIILLVLAVVTVALIFRNQNVNTLDENSDFAVVDTASITRIFLADKNNNTVLLQRGEDQKWTVNNVFPASTYSIGLFMKTLMSVDVKSPVSRNSHDNIVKVLASSSVKVEIYQRAYRIDLFGSIRWFPYEKLSKTYYVGFATQDNQGTYMLMEGSAEPFIVHIPGFKGFLSTRYSPFEKDWRDHKIFSYKYKDLKSVKLWMPEYPDQSFMAVKKDMRNFELYSLNGPDAVGEKMPVFDTLEVMDLFSSFEDIRFEALVDDLDPKIIDSIKNAPPYHVLTLETAGGEKNLLKSWHKKGAPDNVDSKGNPLPWDPDRMYASINNDADFVLIQFFVFDRIFRPLDSFLPQKNPATAP